MLAASRTRSAEGPTPSSVFNLALKLSNVCKAPARFPNFISAPIRSPTQFEYDVPLAAGSQIWATITGPGAAGSTAMFDDLGNGSYQLDWPLKRVGSYRFTVHAGGPDLRRGPVYPGEGTDRRSLAGW